MQRMMWWACMHETCRQIGSAASAFGESAEGGKHIGAALERIGVNKMELILRISPIFVNAESPN